MLELKVAIGAKAYRVEYNGSLVDESDDYDHATYLCAMHCRDEKYIDPIVGFMVEVDAKGNETGSYATGYWRIVKV